MNIIDFYTLNYHSFRFFVELSRYLYKKSKIEGAAFEVLDQTLEDIFLGYVEAGNLDWGTKAND